MRRQPATAPPRPRAARTRAARRRARLRIIAGRWRGRRWRFPTARSARPATGCARRCSTGCRAGSSGRRCLDLFAGSGALGLEALRAAPRTACSSISDARRDRRACATLLREWGAASGSAQLEHAATLRSSWRERREPSTWCSWIRRSPAGLLAACRRAAGGARAGWRPAPGLPRASAQRAARRPARGLAALRQRYRRRGRVSSVRARLTAH